MPPSCMRPLYRGLKALTALSLQPVLLELVGTTIPQIASPQLIGLLIRALRPGELQAKKCFLDGGRELAVRQSPFQA